MLNFLKKVENICSIICKVVSGGCMFIIFCIFLLGILKKYIPSIPVLWIEEANMFFVTYLINFGAAECVRTGEHFMVDLVTDKIKGTMAGNICRLITCLITVVFFCIVAFFGFHLVARCNIYMSVITWLSRKYYYLAIPLAACLMVAYSLRDLVLSIMAFGKKPETPAQQ